jgi:hypothetical protein
VKPRRTIAILLWTCSLLIACTTHATVLPVSTNTSAPAVTFSPQLAITSTPASPYAAIDKAIVMSRDGSYLIACQLPELVLLDAKSHATISKLDLGHSFCPRNIRWSRDNSYAIVVDEDGTLYRWKVHENQPEKLDINIDLEPNRHTGNTIVITGWSDDENYLAVFKECKTYVTQPFGGPLLQHPLIVGDGCVAGFRWATNDLLMIETPSSYIFYQIPTGINVGHWSRIEGCIEEVPSISPDQYWMVFHQCDTTARFNSPPVDQYTIANLQLGNVEIFSSAPGNYIDFIGWKDDGAEFYFISRSFNPDSKPDPRTPFGLLALDPKTGVIKNLFEQVWFAAFNKDLSWAFVVFPAQNEEGTIRLDGGLWQVGTSELKNKQVMDKSDRIRVNGERNHDFPSHIALLSPTGTYLGYSSAFTHLRPAAWSHNNTRVALINADRQLAIIDLEGNVQVVTQLEGAGAGIYGDVAWSHDDKLIILGEKTFPVP